MNQKQAQAAELLRETGWLSRQPAKFQDEVIARGRLQRFEPDEPVYRFAGPPGGIYGLVEGALAISLAPPNATPRFIQFGIIGAWAGEGPFITGEPRRAEMRAVTQCALFHLSLNAMEQMAANDPQAIRYFARITIGHFDVMARVIDDLLIPQADRRIAAVLHRAGWLHPATIPISQAVLAAMANVSRKQVNAVLSRFAASGWISHGYRSIEIRDADALLEFSSGDT